VKKRAKTFRARKKKKTAECSRRKGGVESTWEAGEMLGEVS